MLGEEFQGCLDADECGSAPSLAAILEAGLCLPTL